MAGCNAIRREGPMAGEEPARPRTWRRRLTRRWPLVEIATVVAAVAAVLTWLVPRGDGPAAGPSADARATSSAAPAPSGGSTGGPPSSSPTAPAVGGASGGLPLTALTPSEGGSYLSGTGGASTLVLRCPSGAPGDTSRTVVYDVRGQFHRLTAQVRVTGSPQPPVRSALEILADDIRGGLVVVDGNGDQQLSVDLTVPDPRGADPRPADRLSLRITCRLVGPTVTLVEPRLS
jgi:hypothetical protein